MLALALCYFIYESRFATSSVDSLVAKDVATEVDTSLDTSESNGTSIAVLPFVNMSDDAANEYFSDGISEEILNVLVKVPRLKVTSRSSAFFYKGNKINLSEVAAKLGVEHVLEGSVRKAGNRVRITAQLIKAKTDTHLWSETYDRELTDIFAIQDEISAAIVKALKSKLGLNIVLATRDMSKVNLDAHNEYLQGRFYIENRDQADLEKALSHFDKAIELDPDYALAWMGKGWANLYLSEYNYGDIPHDIALVNARESIEKALQLAPDLPEAHGVMGLIEADNSNREKAITHYKKAIELNPNYADVYVWYSLEVYDQHDKRFELVQMARQLKPMSLNANTNYAYDLVLYGKLDEARAVVNHLQSINASYYVAHIILAAIKVSEGNYAEAIIDLDRATKLAPEDIVVKFIVATHLATLGLFDEAAAYFNGTDFDYEKYWFKGEKEKYISAVRATYPPIDNYDRALAETRIENYSEAIKYFNFLKTDEANGERIYSYQQIGDAENAQRLLLNAKIKIQLYVDSGAQSQYRQYSVEPIELAEMEFACLEGDIEQAIMLLNKAMEINYIVNFAYKTEPMYKKLRQHSQWPAIIAESDKRAAVQREIYLGMLAKGDN